MPVWWLPHVYGGLWLAAVAAVLLRRGLVGAPPQPAGPWGWAALLLSLLLLGVGGWCGARALAGRALPPVEVIDIASPFGSGRYLVGHGGSIALVNGHLRTLDPTVDRFRPWRGQSYAVDFFGLDSEPDSVRHRSDTELRVRPFAIANPTTRYHCR